MALETRMKTFKPALLLATLVSFASIAGAQLDPLHHDPAREAAAAAASKKGTEINKLLLKAEDLMLDGKFDEAERKCRQAINLYSDMIDQARHMAAPYLGEILFEQGNYADALTVLGSYADPGSGRAPIGVEASRALCLFNQGNLDAAAATLRAALSRDPDYLSTRMGLDAPDLTVGDADTVAAVCHIIRGTQASSNHRMAVHRLEELRVAKKSIPANLGVDYLIGDAEFWLSDYKAAVDSWKPIEKSDATFLKAKIAVSYRIAVDRAAKSSANGAQSQKHD